MSMPRLGPLERAVMDTVWAMTATASNTPAARDLRGSLPKLAYTTVITVLDRLVQKGLLERVSDDRPHRYRATGSQASYAAGVMHEALAATSYPSGALIMFVEMATPEQLAALRGGLAIGRRAQIESRENEEVLV